MRNLGPLANHCSHIPQIYQPIRRKGSKVCILFSSRKPHAIHLCSDSGTQFRLFASQNSEKKLRSIGKKSKPSTKKHTPLAPKGFEDSEDNTLEGNDGCCNTFSEPVGDNLNLNCFPKSPARNAVLKACAITSGFLLILGLLIRQASHVASVEGWPILDASAEVQFSFEMQHIPLTIGTVALVSSCRYILLKTWPEFSESSEAANQQVLGLLQPLDYLVVAFLPGISEELFFRGALLPLLGLSWNSAVVVGAIFGGLHLGGGRRFPFAIWASFVGFTYGMATIVSSSIIVPMVSHSLCNLIGAILWRYKSSSNKIIG